MTDQQKSETKNLPFPGILIKRNKIWHYQVRLKGSQKFWKRSTHEANYRRALAVAKTLHQQALLLSDTPNEQPRLAKAIMTETMRLEDEISSRQADRVNIALNNFLAWSDDIALEKIDTDMLDRYQRHRLRSQRKTKTGTLLPPPAANTVRCEIIYVRRMLRENGILIAKPKDRTGLAALGRPFTRDELTIFFKACATGRHTNLFLLMLATGARPAELLPSPRSTHKPLLKSEIDLETNTVTIRSAKIKAGGRGRVSRIEVEPALLRNILDEAPDGSYAFPVMQPISRIFNEIAERAKIVRVDELGQKLTSHSFRHSFGTMLAERGDNAFIIQNLMRHASPAMTSRYTERAKPAAAIIDISPWFTPSAPEEVHPKAQD